jgi:lipopolysaccharide export LptBFGC system permease protein LptF
MLNFILISEICPFSKKKTKELLNRSLYHQPVALLDDEQFGKAKNLICLSSSTSQNIKKDLLIAFSNSHSQPLSLILAKELAHEKGQLLMKNVHIFSLTEDISTKKSLVESYASLHASIESLTPHYRKYHDTFSYEELSTKNCLIKLLKTSFQEKHKGYFELSKRFFFFLIPISFLVLAAACATSLGRESKSSIKILIFLTILVLVSYFLGKSFEKKPCLAAGFFLGSQACLFIVSIRHLSKIQKGLAT